MAPLLDVHNWMREILQDCGKASLLQAFAIGGKASKAVKKGDASNRSLPLSCILREPESTHMTNLEVINRPNARSFLLVPNQNQPGARNTERYLAKILR